MRFPTSLFLKEFISNPKSIGAICASSERIGARMASHIDLHRDGWVIELGGGTGSITQSLLDHGIPEEKLIVIEKSHKLSECLSKNFPKTRVIHGDAENIAGLIDKGLDIKAVISGLPLRSLPGTAVEKITSGCRMILPVDAKLIQFTYIPGATSPWQSAGFEKIASENVWMNIPPARIDVFARFDKYRY